MQVLPGSPLPLGATPLEGGVNFAVFSEHGTRVELCLFDAEEPSRELRRVELPARTHDVFHGFVPGLAAGALYGFRVHGPWAPSEGLRFNPAKLLLDPYARALRGELSGPAPLCGEVLDARGRPTGARCERDSAPFVPRSVVVDGAFDWEGDAPLHTPWTKTVLYEAHVRGMTMLHPEVPPALRGTYAGLAHPAVVGHLRALGVTAVELLPVHEALDEPFLVRRGRTNYWGYATAGYFAPEQRYAHAGPGAGAVREFKEMVKGLHRAGIEVILDVVYNHTCEGGPDGHTLCFRGLDNSSYYRLRAEDRSQDEDFTGTGNSLNFKHPRVVQLVMDSLRYWVEAFHVDGFRFDLAPTLGRGTVGTFNAGSDLLVAMRQDPVLQRVKLIAEPWDVGPGGYQLGRFPPPFAEWNDRFRDGVRRFWRGDAGLAPELAWRLTGSSDQFHGGRRGPLASINFVAAHDGLTLHDVCAYERKHNEANGEQNRDGHEPNHSWNHGVEGETDDAEVEAARAQDRRNLVATLLLSQGVPMLLGGDELGRTQQGNNNAYCQDNALSWVDWGLDADARQLLAWVKRLVGLRAKEPALQWTRFLGDEDARWTRPSGEPLTRADWEDPALRAFAVELRRPDGTGGGLLLLLNAGPEEVAFTVPGEGRGFRLELDSANPAEAAGAEVGGAREVAGRSLVVLRHAAP
jgi:glycogen operon protein